MSAVTVPDDGASELVQIGFELALVAHNDVRNEDVGKILCHHPVVLRQNKKIGKAFSTQLTRMIPANREELTTEHATLFELRSGRTEKI